MLKPAAVMMLCGCALAEGTAEDPQLRAMAVGLIERSRQLGSPVWPMNEETFTFCIPNPEPGEDIKSLVRPGVAAVNLKR